MKIQLTRYVFAISCFFIIGISPEIALAQETGIDATINAITAPIATLVGNIVFFKIPVFGAQLPLVVLWLVIGAVFFTVYMGFINIRGFKHAIELVRGDYSDPNSHGEVSHFKLWQQSSPEQLVLVISEV